ERGAVQVLIVEDNPSVARFLEQAVREAGYTSLMVGDGLAALEAAGSGDFDLILLDVMLPGLDGFSVCKRLRAAGVRTPILILTAKDTTADKIEGLDSGADDYIVKPFHVGELLARMRALLRRGASAPALLAVGDLTLDPATRRARRGGKDIPLSATEYALLEYLMRNAGRVLTRSMILQHVWQYDFAGTDNVLEVYISYLRRKIDKGHAAALLHTVRGTGYRMEAP
ncbi:MAG TPA: response regulator transcription factor, partial [Armatimonadota bacterium]